MNTRNKALQHVYILYLTMPKKGNRSALQRAQLAQNHDIIRTKGKENSVPIALAVTETELAKALHQVELEKQRGNDYKRRNHNEHRKQLRSEIQIKSLKSQGAETFKEAARTREILNLVTKERDVLAERNVALEERNSTLKRQKDTLKKSKDRAAGAKAAAVGKAKVVRLKEKGIILEASRDTIRELIRLGVPVEHVDGVLRAVAGGLGITIQDSISARSVARIILEGGVAAKMQLAHLIINTDCE